MDHAFLTVVLDFHKGNLRLEQLPLEYSIHVNHINIIHYEVALRLRFNQDISC